MYLSFRSTLGFASAVAFGLWALGPAAAQTQRPTVAVIPFENTSGDAAQNFFAEGMTDEIAAALSGVRGIDVVARSSSFRLKEPMPTVKAAGEQLHARYLIDGAARMVQGRVRLNLALLRVSDGRQIWAEEYYAESPNIYDIEEDAAEKIAAALSVPVPNGETVVRSRTAEFDVYLNFLRAKVAARDRGPRALADAAVILERVVARDPNYAPAAAMLAYDYALTPLFAPSLRSGMPDEERKVVARTIPKSDELAQRATRLDPRSADAFVALGYANLVQHKMIAAEDAFKQALLLNPNQADGLHGYSQFLAAMGKVKESLALREHLQDIEQSIVNYTADTAEIYWLDGQTDKAIQMLQPFRPGRTLELALIQASAGRYRESAAALREMPATNYPPGMLENAAKVLDSAPAKAASSTALPRLGNMSFAYMHVDAPERVLEFYEDEVRAGYFQPISTTWFWHPTYAAVRKTERFKQLARDLGLVDYWRARGWPMQCGPLNGNDFTCS